MDEGLESLLATGVQARLEGRLDDAFDAFQCVANQSHDVGSERRLVRALSGLGQIERDRSALDSAQRHYVAALNVSRALDDSLLIAGTARHLGDIFREIGLNEQAEPLLTEAISRYRRSLNTKVLDLANALRPLALLLASRGDASAARSLWQEARVLYSAVNVSAGTAECDAQIAKGEP